MSLFIMILKKIYGLIGFGLVTFGLMSTNASRAGTFYMGQYSQIKIERLGEQYDTDCVEYGIGKKFLTRNDCLLSCHQDEHDRICNDSSTMVNSVFLVRKQIFNMNANRLVNNCEEYENMEHDIFLNCWKHCKQACTYSYYRVDFQELEDMDFGHSRLFAEHNEMPDILIKYIPEISFISFICNFGGLLGMWLGLSFLTMANYFKNLMSNKEVFAFRSKQSIDVSNRFFVTSGQTFGRRRQQRNRFFIHLMSNSPQTN